MNSRKLVRLRLYCLVAWQPVLLLRKSSDSSIKNWLWLRLSWLIISLLRRLLLRLRLLRVSGLNNILSLLRLGISLRYIRILRQWLLLIRYSSNLIKMLLCPPCNLLLLLLRLLRLWLLHVP